jgi:hypothetical protein
VNFLLEGLDFVLPRQSVTVAAEDEPTDLWNKDAACARS